VPGRFLDKLLGRASSLSPEVAEALAELTRLKAKRPTLLNAIQLLEACLPRLFADPQAEQLPAISAGAARAKSEAGTPLLRGEKIELNIAAFRRRWKAVCAAIQEYQNVAAGKAIAQALDAGRLVPDDLLRSVLEAKPEEIHRQADALGLNAELTSAVLGLVLLPTLSRLHAGLASLRQDSTWDSGYCPTCGSWPLLGEFRGLEQVRFLRCGLCAAEWEFPRLRCLYCGEGDHRQLGYFSVEGEESRHRAAVCQSCHGYVKMVSSLAPLSAPGLLVANVATLHLDLAAVDRGYLSPPILPAGEA
jgi:FdhE protein